MYFFFGGGVGVDFCSKKQVILNWRPTLVWLSAFASIKSVELDAAQNSSVDFAAHSLDILMSSHI